MVVASENDDRTLEWFIIGKSTPAAPAIKNGTAFGSLVMAPMRLSG